MSVLALKRLGLSAAIMLSTWAASMPATAAPRPVVGVAAAGGATKGAVTKDGFVVPAGFRSSYREIDGVRFHYVAGGSGPLVILFTASPRLGTNGTN